MTLTEVQQIAPDLRLEPEGWWSSPKVSQVAYPEYGNEYLFEVEDASFWFAHRNRCILEALRQFPPPGPLFDVGGGNGYVASAIQATGKEVVLVEPGLAGVRNALKRGIRHVVRATLEDAGVLPATLPAVGMFDVIEHVKDDAGFLAGIHRLLVPGGRIYATVPAYQWLWSDEDVTAGHSRRYTIGSLGRLLRDVGLTVEFATCFFGFLPLPILLLRALPYRLGLRGPGTSPEQVQADHKVASPLTRQILALLTDWEIARLAQRRSIAFGGSCLIVARKC